VPILYLVEDLTGRLIEGLHAGRLDVVLLALPSAIRRASLAERAVLAGREVFLGRRGAHSPCCRLSAPAEIASIAYMDLGNFATNNPGWRKIWLRTPLGDARPAAAAHRLFHCLRYHEAAPARDWHP
jgi:hypothetical protein